MRVSLRILESDDYADSRRHEPPSSFSTSCTSCAAGMFSSAADQASVPPQPQSGKTPQRIFLPLGSRCLLTFVYNCLILQSSEGQILRLTLAGIPALSNEASHQSCVNIRESKDRRGR